MKILQKIPKEMVKINVHTLSVITEKVCTFIFTIAPLKTEKNYLGNVLILQELLLAEINLRTSW